MQRIRKHNAPSMEHLKKIIAFRVTRFGLAGLINTAVSFLLNRSFVFLDKERPVRKLARFIMVSVAGVFLIQNSVYAVCLVLLHSREAGVIRTMQSITGYQLSSNFVDVNLSNLVASFAV